MVNADTISICYKRHCSGFRQAVAMLVAYGMAMHQILLAFAVTAMTVGIQKPADSLFMQSAPARQFIMILCRPGAMWTDSNDASTPLDVAHLKGCCGISAVQSAGVLNVANKYTALSLATRSAYISWYFKQTQKPDSYHFTPAARGPPFV